MTKPLSFSQGPGWTPIRDQPTSFRGRLKAATGKGGLCPGPRPTVEGLSSPSPRGRAKGGQARVFLNRQEASLQGHSKDWKAHPGQRARGGNWSSLVLIHPCRGKTYPSVPSTRDLQLPATRGLQEPGGGPRTAQALFCCQAAARLLAPAATPQGYKVCPLPPRCDEIKSGGEHEGSSYI